MPSTFALLSFVETFANAASLPLAEMASSAMSAAWGIVIFSIILGLLVALNPSRRTREIKRPRDE